MHESFSNIPEFQYFEAALPHFKYCQTLFLLAYIKLGDNCIQNVHLGRYIVR